MSLLNQIIREAAQKELIESAAAGATSAGDVAGFRAPLGATSKKRKKKKRKMRRRAMPTGQTFALKFAAEGIEDQKFDQADVISKLKAAEQKAHNEEDTRGFALEDEEGRIVKVYVQADQADDFEAALGAALAGEEDDLSTTDEEVTSMEIAEVLFNMKDKFTIVDVQWPEIEEDQEVEVEDAEADLSDDLEGGEGEGEGEGEDLDMEAELQGDEEMDDLEGGEGDDAMGALQSIIDLLKSQADAAKAEANAKEAEANAKEAEANAKAAEAKVKQEEEILDMEAYYDEKNQADKEAKQLQKLAKWKHETAQDADAEISKTKTTVSVGEEQQEVHGALPGDEIPGNKFEEPGPDENQDKKLQPGEFVKYMIKHIQRN